MTFIKSDYVEHQLKRGRRPDAHLFVRPDWRRHIRPSFESDFPFALYDRKYRPDQPRVPRGNPDGGQWTDAAGGGGGSPSGRNDPRILSDAIPDNDWKPGAQYAQRRPRGAGRVVINGQSVEPTPGQAARLAVVQAQAQDAIRRVRELDPTWKPTQSEFRSVEGLISAYRADALQAQGRIKELGRVGIGPGPYAGASIPARGPDRSFKAAERRENNRNGLLYGCHTCGTRDPGTKSGDFVLDHQDPTGLNSSKMEQRLYPQCLSCSLRQGGWVNKLKPR